jgi:acyl-CoA thioesterase-1
MRFEKGREMNRPRRTAATVAMTMLLLTPVAATLAACGGDGATNRAAGASTGVASQPAPERDPQSTGAAPAGATGSATGAPGAARARVVILGTSLTAGLGLTPDQAYPSLLQRKADSAGFRVDIVNAGLSGETSAGALRRASWVLDQPAAAVVLEVGANDGLRGVNPDSTHANLVALVGTIRRTHPAARVMLVQMEAPTNLGRDYTTRFHDAYARAARDAGVPLLPFLLDGVAGNPRFNQADGIHPNLAGSRLVAENMWDALRPVLDSLTTGR